MKAALISLTCASLALVAMTADAAPSKKPAAAASLPVGTVAKVKADLDGDGKADSVRLVAEGGELRLVVDTAKGRNAELPVGAFPLEFLLDGAPTKLATRDVDGDGKAEILAAAGVGDRGLLFVLRWTGAESDPLVSLYREADAFASDTGAFPDALSFGKNGRIVIAGQEFTEDGPREATFAFDWNPAAKTYELKETTPAPKE